MSDSPDFTPVPTATRHDGWTPERQRAFIAALAQHGGVAAAARNVGMTPQGARKLRRRPGAESFAFAWDCAVALGRDRARDEAMRRGRDGWWSPVMRDGRVVGHRHRFDNRLLFAACYGEPMGRYLRSLGMPSAEAGGSERPAACVRPELVERPSFPTPKGDASTSAA